MTAPADPPPTTTKSNDSVMSVDGNRSEISRSRAERCHTTGNPRPCGFQWPRQPAVCTLLIQSGSSHRASGIDLGCGRAQGHPLLSGTDREDRLLDGARVPAWPGEVQAGERGHW